MIISMPIFSMESCPTITDSDLKHLTKKELIKHYNVLRNRAERKKLEMDFWHSQCGKVETEATNMSPDKMEFLKKKEECKKCVMELNKISAHIEKRKLKNGFVNVKFQRKLVCF